MIWRDADEPGRAYARDVIAGLAKLSPAPSVAIVDPPEGVAEGWDAADALAEGWTKARAAELIAAAAPPARAESEPAPRKPGPKEVLLDLIGGIELWHDPEGVPHASVPVNGHLENCEVGSAGFKDWIAAASLDATGTVPATEAIEAVLRIARVKALRGPCCRTFRRVAEHEGRLYLDLGCARWRAVEIAATGWEVIATAPVKFLRSRGMEPLPEPEAGDMIEGLREFVNVEADADFRLLVTWLTAALRPTGPFAILIVTGQQGASKSTRARICRRLVDPNASPIRAVPKDERDLIVSAFNSWLLVYDNLSSVPAWLSDALCRLSTGGGFATRQLHSDRDEAIFAAQRPIVLNGIGDLAARPDLADRTLTITLPPLAEDQAPRRAGVLERLSRRLCRDCSARCSMASRAGCASCLMCGSKSCRAWPISPAGARHALRALAGNRATFCATTPRTEAMPSRLRLRRRRCFRRSRPCWRAPGLMPTGFDGTAAELLEKLAEVCGEPERRARWYPATPSQAGSALRRIAPLLRSRGIEFLPYKDGDRNRTRQLKLRCASEAGFDELRARLMGRRRGSDAPA